MTLGITGLGVRAGALYVRAGATHLMMFPLFVARGKIMSKQSRNLEETRLRDLEGLGRVCRARFRAIRMGCGRV